MDQSALIYGCVAALTVLIIFVSDIFIRFEKMIAPSSLFFEPRVGIRATRCVSDDKVEAQDLHPALNLVTLCPRQLYNLELIYIFPALSSTSILVTATHSHP